MTSEELYPAEGHAETMPAPLRQPTLRIRVTPRGCQRANKSNGLSSRPRSRLIPNCSSHALAKLLRSPRSGHTQPVSEHAQTANSAREIAGDVGRIRCMSTSVVGWRLLPWTTARDAFRSRRQALACARPHAPSERSIAQLALITGCADRAIANRPKVASARKHSRHRPLTCRREGLAS